MEFGSVCKQLKRAGIWVFTSASADDLRFIVWDLGSTIPSDGSRECGYEVFGVVEPLL